MDLGLVLIEKSEMVEESFEQENRHHGFSLQGLSVWSWMVLLCLWRVQLLGAMVLVCRVQLVSRTWRHEAQDLAPAAEGEGSNVTWRNVTARCVHVTSNAKETEISLTFYEVAETIKEVLKSLSVSLLTSEGLLTGTACCYWDGPLWPLTSTRHLHLCAAEHFLFSGSFSVEPQRWWWKSQQLCEVLSLHIHSLSSLFLDFELQQVVFINVCMPWTHSHCRRVIGWLLICLNVHQVCQMSSFQFPHRCPQLWTWESRPWRTLKDPEGPGCGSCETWDMCKHLYYEKIEKNLSVSCTRRCGVSCLAYNDSSWLFLTATFQHHACTPTAAEPSHPRRQTAQPSRPRCLWLWIVEWKITFN